VIIDGHVHFWDMARLEDILIVRLQPRLQRDYLPLDLGPLLRAHGADKAVLVQSAPSPDHTRWCLDIAKREERVASVVGWVDLEAPNASDMLSAYKAEPKFAGIRAMVNRAPEPDWLLRPAVRQGFAAVGQAKLVAELLVRPHHLPACLTLCKALPALRVVIDHGGQPDIQADAWEPWATDIAEIGRATTAACKIAGLAEVAGPGWTAERLKPFFGHLLECFGPERLLFGSNWPVIDLVGDFHAWWEAFHQLLDGFGLGEDERGALLGGTAARVYSIAPV
jgi:L-fuconolactonase